MRIISDTSSILNLAIINRLDLLRRQFDRILIPPTVLAELRPESELSGTAAIREAVCAGWIRATKLQDERLAHVLALELDGGEAAVIALALELGIGRILLDERDGRTTRRKRWAYSLSACWASCCEPNETAPWTRSRPRCRRCGTKPGFSLRPTYTQSC